jgi:predicted ATP-dependent endonuclease of OLD family
MRLLRYNLKRLSEEQFDFDETRFARINILVGDSGTGKTRFLNTIVNFFSQLVSEKVKFPGKWDVDFEIDGIVYNYKLNVTQSPISPHEQTIGYEVLSNNRQVLFERNNGTILWQNKDMPKLSSEMTCFSLLKNEDIINPIYLNLKKIIARRFSGDELNKNFLLGTFTIPDMPNPPAPPHIRKLGDLAVEQIDFHNKMNILSKIDSSGYNKVVALIKTAFPFIIDAGIRNIAQVLPDLPAPIHTPVFCIKERNVSDWIPCIDISSGMQKLFLLILDTYLLQDSGILLIDEYENSLGINAINFLPDLINSISQNCQFIITSHHPYIINNIPIESWKVFHRDGVNVHITDGITLKERYSKSRQEYFVQLINDPLYTGGVE